MKSKAILHVYILLFFLPISVFAQTINNLASAKTIVCTFAIGATYYSDKSGNYEGIKILNEPMTFTFDSINLRSKSARFIGNRGASDVYVDLTPSGLHLIEKTDLGNRIYTTIYPHIDYNTNYLATTSRHIYLPGNPGVTLSSQWHGACKIADSY